MVTDVVARVKSRLSAVQKAFSQATATIVEIRHEIETLRAERQRIASAPRPMSEVVACLDRMLEHWCIAGQNSGITIDGIIDNALADRPLTIELHRNCTLGQVLTLLTPLLLPTLRETLISRLEAAYANIPAGLPVEERQRELARLDEQLLALERAEEQALQVAEANGLAIDRREDADPRVVLGVSE